MLELISGRWTRWNSCPAEEHPATDLTPAAVRAFSGLRRRKKTGTMMENKADNCFRKANDDYQ